MLVAALLCAVATGNQALANNRSLEEDELKAAFIYKFAHFVTWPSGQKRTIRFCLTGRRSFVSALETTLHKIKSSPFEAEIRHIRWGQDATQCNILFIAESISARYETSLRKLGESRVLTIGESPGFADRGGMINFTWEGRRIRLEINRDAVKKSGLVISSHVLKLARLVGGHSQ